MNKKMSLSEMITYSTVLIRGTFIMIRTVTLNKNQKPTDEQTKQIKEAAKKPIVFYEDSPELTPAMEKAFRLAAKNRNTQRKANIS